MRIFHSHLTILKLISIHAPTKLHHVLLIIVRHIIIINKRELVLHSLDLKVKLITWLIVRNPLVWVRSLNLANAHIGVWIDIVLVHLVYVCNLGCIRRAWELGVVVGLRLRVAALVLYLIHIILVVILVVNLLRNRESLLYLVIFIYLFVWVDVFKLLTLIEELLFLIVRAHCLINVFVILLIWRMIIFKVWIGRYWSIWGVNETIIYLKTIFAVCLNIFLRIEVKFPIDLAIIPLGFNCLISFLVFTLLIAVFMELIIVLLQYIAWILIDISYFLCAVYLIC